MNWQEVKHVYILGCGGSGVSAIAWLCLKRGIKLSGSDMVANEATAALQQAGATIVIGHRAENLTADVDLVVFSVAVTADNPELVKARELGVTCLSYPQMLGELSRQYQTLAVAGTNGKSTVTAMLGTILQNAGRDPSVILGAPVVEWGRVNFRAGTSNLLVVEACEYRAHFLNLHPLVGVITNIAADHLDFYHDLEEIKKSFNQFTNLISPDGVLVFNNDDRNTVEVVSSVGLKHKISFGLTSAAQLWASDIKRSLQGVGFDIHYQGHETTCRLPMAGQYNISNALAAVAAALAIGVPLNQTVQALQKYQGLVRRLELVGQFNGAPVLSDYAHHPDGIKQVIGAVRQLYPNRRLVVLFQPHQGNRTRMLMDEFSQAFNEADEMVIAEIYRVAGREQGADAQVSSRQLTELIKERFNKSCQFAPSEAAAESLIRSLLKSSDVLLVMGAGTIDNVARNLLPRIVSEAKMYSSLLPSDASNKGFNNHAT